MDFIVNNWLAIVAVANTALLVFLVAEGRGVPARLAFVAQRLDKLDRALRTGRLTGVTNREPPVKLISDRSTTAPASESTGDPYRHALRAVR